MREVESAGVEAGLGGGAVGAEIVEVGVGG